MALYVDFPLSLAALALPELPLCRLPAGLRFPTLSSDVPSLSKNNMATQRKNISSMSLTKNEIFKLQHSLQDPQFRQLFCEYAQELNAPDAKACYEKEVQQYELEQGNRCHFFHPKDGYVIKTANLRTDEKVFINACSDDLVASGGLGKQPGVPYACGQPRRDLDKAGRPCTVYDVVFTHETLQGAMNNSKAKRIVTDIALDAIEKNFNVKLGRQDLRFPKLKFKGQFKPTVIRKPLSESDEEHDPGLPEERSSSKKKTPQHTLKYQHNLKDDLPSSTLSGRRTGRVDDPCRPTHVFVEVSLPEMQNAKTVQLDLDQAGMTLESDEPEAYSLNLSFAYPVEEEEAVARFDKAEHKLTVTVPVKPAQEVKRLVSTDSAIEVDTGYYACTEDDAKEEKETIQEKKDASILPPYNCNIYEDLMIFTLDVARVDESTLVKSFSSSSDTLDFSLRFSSVGTGLVRLDYAFCCSLPLSGLSVVPASSEPLEVEVWDNNVLVKVNLPKGEECEKYKVGSTEDDLTIHMLPQLRALRKKKEKMMKDAPVKASSLDDDCAFEAPSSTNASKSAEDSKERHSSGDSDDSLLSATNQRFNVTKADEEQREEVFLSDGRALRSILKSRKQRCFSESQAELMSWNSSTVSSSSCLSSCAEEGEEKSVKKSVSFNKTVQRQIFKPTSSIFGLTAKNQKKKEQKKKRAERRASEGDASATEEEREEEKVEEKEPSEEHNDDSGVASSVDEGGEGGKTSKRKNRKKRGKKQSKAALSEATNDLIFDLDI